MFHIDPNDLTDHLHRPDPQHASHLKECAQCRAELQFLRDIRATWDSGDEVPEKLIERTLPILWGRWVTA